MTYPNAVHVKPSDSGSIITRISSEQAGWRYLNAAVMLLDPEQKINISIDQYEYVAIILGGLCHICTSRGDFTEVGRRPDVFTGMPYAIYMPRQTDFEIEALTEDFSVAMCWCPTNRDFPIRLIQPEQVEMEIIGGNQASYQVNHIITPRFAAHRLIVREMYIPGGNWANYPPVRYHNRTGQHEALYLIKQDRPAGFAVMQAETDENRMQAHLLGHNDLVAIHDGFHTFNSGPGYNTYLLSILAGDTRQNSATTDPQHDWFRQTWLHRDARLPLVDHGMEPYRPASE